MDVCTQSTNSDVCSQLATTPEVLFKIGDRQSEQKWRSEGNMQCDTWFVTLGTEYSGTRVSLTALTEHV